MLLLIGLGLDKNDISTKSMEMLEKADRILLDRYTNPISEEYIASISHHTGKEVELLHRSDLEENAAKTIERAKREDIAILVAGDPLIATTHHTLLDLAKKLDIETRVFHSSSIFSAAIGECGLDIYKFGPTTTIPFWSENYKPVSFLDVIELNKANKQHSMILLDYDYKNERKMTLEEAISLLLKANKGKRQPPINGNTKLLILGDIGKEGQRIAYVTFETINEKAYRAFSGKTLTLIFPGELNFAEEEAISKFFLN